MLTFSCRFFKSNSKFKMCFSVFFFIHQQFTWIRQFSDNDVNCWVLLIVYCLSCCWHYCRRRIHRRCRRRLVRHFVVHDTLESRAQCKDSFDIRDNGIWFCVAICGCGHRLCSNSSCSPVPDRAEWPDNVAIDFPAIVHGWAALSLYRKERKVNKFFQIYIYFWLFKIVSRNSMIYLYVTHQWRWHWSLQFLPLDPYRRKWFGRNRWN